MTERAQQAEIETAIEVIERAIVVCEKERDVEGDHPYYARQIRGFQTALAALRSSFPSGEKDAGGHESHGGRGDLGAAARPELPHDET